MTEDKELMEAIRYFTDAEYRKSIEKYEWIGYDKHFTILLYEAQRTAQLEKALRDAREALRDTEASGKHDEAIASINAVLGE